MRITQRPSDPAIWEFHELDEAQRDEVARFIERWNCTIVNPWEPMAISLGKADAEQAFRQQFGASVEAA